MLKFCGQDVWSRSFVAAVAGYLLAKVVLPEMCLLQVSETSRSFWHAKIKLNHARAHSSNPADTRCTCLASKPWSVRLSLIKPIIQMRTKLPTFVHHPSNRAPPDGSTWKSIPGSGPPSSEWCQRHSPCSFGNSLRKLGFSVCCWIVF